MPPSSNASLGRIVQRKRFYRFATSALDPLVHRFAHLPILGRRRNEVVEETVQHVERPLRFLSPYVDVRGLLIVLLSVSAEVSDLAEVVKVLPQAARYA